MEAKSSRTPNRALLSEGLILVVLAMIILVAKVNTPISEFFLGVLIGMWVVAVLAFLAAVGRTYIWKPG